LKQLYSESFLAGDRIVTPPRQYKSPVWNWCANGSLQKRQSKGLKSAVHEAEIENVGSEHATDNTNGEQSENGEAE
jgi:hypothetical protein